MVENLVGYAKSDLVVPAEVSVGDIVAANTEAARWRAELTAAQVSTEACTS